MEKYHIFIILSVIVILILYFLYVPIDTHPLNDSYAVCDNGEVKVKKSNTGNSILDATDNILMNSMKDLSLGRENMLCSLQADSEPFFGNSAKIKIACKNNIPILICKTRLYKAILLGKIKFISTDKKITINEDNDFNYEKKCLEICPEGLDKIQQSMWEGKGYSVEIKEDYIRLDCLCRNGRMYGFHLDKNNFKEIPHIN